MYVHVNYLVPILVAKKNRIVSAVWAPSIDYTLSIPGDFSQRRASLARFQMAILLPEKSKYCQWHSTSAKRKENVQIDVSTVDLALYFGRVPEFIRENPDEKILYSIQSLYWQSASIYTVEKGAMHPVLRKTDQEHARFTQFLDEREMS